MHYLADDVPYMGVRELRARLADGSFQVVDVREGWEWTRGHIQGALHIPLGELAARLGEIDATREVAFICHLGGRSLTATRFGLAHGLAGALNVRGGMDDWEAHAYEVV